LFLNGIFSAIPFITDILNFSGADAVGSAVCFKNGQPSKNDYRKYKIKTVDGINDFEMMRELLFRHFNNIKEKKIVKPDLVLIDGGKQHLNIAIQVLRYDLQFDKNDFLIIALAKEEETIFLEDKEMPLNLDKSTQALRLLQFLRDEAHRFGVEYHKTLRSKKINLSALDAIKGVGKKIKAQLLTEFKSVENIAFAKIEDLCKIKGVHPKLAEKIKNDLLKT
ncbi:MAG TPA: DUF655 domain-containing protein, partial [bacterium]|nr:DUF655 domain-containing protein [bacterium]